MPEKYIQQNLFDYDYDSDFEYDVVDQTSDGYILDILSTKDGYSYTITNPDGDYLETFDSKVNALDLKRSEYIKSDIFKKFKSTCDKDRRSKYSPAPQYKKETPYDLGPRNWSYSYTPSYKLSKEEALKKYGKSNTICFHKTDPTTTMLDQIYSGKGWDVVNDSNEMSSDTIAALIDAHERVVMLGHGSSGGLIGFINPSHAKNLEPKKLFALWCNADAYCNQYLKDKKGFFACGNMPSDDHEASWVGFEVSHKYMDDNITYWCKLCGDVVEQCLEGDADAGCQYIREKYWERYYKGTADEVGITKYNYVRTKVAGQANLPEPEGEEIEGPKETVRQLRAKESPASSYSGTYRGSYVKQTSSPQYDIDYDFSDGETVFETSTGAYCIGYKAGSSWNCNLYDKQGKALGKAMFSWISKNGQNVYNKFERELPKNVLGSLIIDAEFRPVTTNSEEVVIAETDKGYTIKEKRQANGYQYLLMKNNNLVHMGSNPTKLKPEEAYSDFDAMMDIGNLV